jgi:hypothetical protein
MPASQIEPFSCQLRSLTKLISIINFYNSHQLLITFFHSYLLSLVTDIHMYLSLRKMKSIYTLVVIFVIDISQCGIWSCVRLVIQELGLKNREIYLIEPSWALFIPLGMMAWYSVFPREGNNVPDKGDQQSLDIADGSWILVTSFSFPYYATSMPATNKHSKSCT